MTYEGAINVMSSSKDIIEWNANRDLVAITLGIKIKVPGTLYRYVIDPQNEHFGWFMKEVDSNCVGLMGNTSKR